MKGMPRFGIVGVAVAAAAVLALLVHLVVVLLTPAVASNGAFARLAPLAAVNATTLLPRAGERFLPYADPAVAMAFCRFDLAAGPIRIEAPTGRAFASLSFHGRNELAFYALTDKAASRGRIAAVLATPEDKRALEAQDDEENPSRDLRIEAPESEGYVLMRVFSERPSLLPAAEDEARALTCKPERIAR